MSNLKFKVFILFLLCGKIIIFNIFKNMVKIVIDDMLFEINKFLALL